MKHTIVVSGIVLLLMLTVTGVAFAQGEGGTAGMMDVGAVLAPLAAAALGVERLIEAGWGVVEAVLSLDLIKSRFKPRLDFLKKAKADFDDVDKTNQVNYSKFKVWTSVAAGILLGIVVANMAGLRMFSTIGFANVFEGADKVITGIVIGSGSKFTHDVIGIFTETKKLVENLAELKGKEVKEGKEESEAPPAKS